MDRGLQVTRTPRRDCDPKKETFLARSIRFPVLACPLQVYRPAQLGQRSVRPAARRLVIPERPREATIGYPSNWVVRTDPVMATADLSIDVVSGVDRRCLGLCRKRRRCNVPEDGIVVYRQTLCEPWMKHHSVGKNLGAYGTGLKTELTYRGHRKSVIPRKISQAISFRRSAWFGLLSEHPLQLEESRVVLRLPRKDSVFVRPNALQHWKIQRTVEPKCIPKIFAKMALFHRNKGERKTFGDVNVLFTGLKAPSRADRVTNVVDQPCADCVPQTHDQNLGVPKRVEKANGEGESGPGAVGIDTDDVPAMRGDVGQERTIGVIIRLR